MPNIIHELLQTNDLYLLRSELSSAEQLLNQFDDIDYTPKLRDFRDAIFLAAKDSEVDLKTFEYLLSYSHLFNIHLRDSEGNTLLHLAASAGNIAKVKLLIEYGIEVTEQNYQSQTPLDTASGEGHADIVQYLIIGKFCSLNDNKAHAQNSLNQAIAKDYIEIVKILIINNIFDPRGLFDYSYLIDINSLSFACFTGSFHSLKYLVEKCNMSTWDPYDPHDMSLGFRVQPISIALFEEHFELVRYLNSIDPSEIYRTMIDNIQYDAGRNQYIVRAHSIFDEAIINSKANIIRFVFNELKFEFNSLSEERKLQSLAFALQNDNIEIFEFLLKAFNLNQQHNVYKNILEIAFKYGALNCIKWMINVEGIELMNIVNLYSILFSSQANEESVIEIFQLLTNRYPQYINYPDIQLEKNIDQFCNHPSLPRDIISINNLINQSTGLKSIKLFIEALKHGAKLDLLNFNFQTTIDLLSSTGIFLILKYVEQQVILPEVKPWAARSVLMLVIKLSYQNCSEFESIIKYIKCNYFQINLINKDKNYSELSYISWLPNDIKSHIASYLTLQDVKIKCLNRVSYVTKEFNKESFTNSIDLINLLQNDPDKLFNGFSYISNFNEILIRRVFENAHNHLDIDKYIELIRQMPKQCVRAAGGYIEIFKRIDDKQQYPIENKEKLEVFYKELIEHLEAEITDNDVIISGDNHSYSADG